MINITPGNGNSGVNFILNFIKELLPVLIEILINLQNIDHKNRLHYLHITLK